MDKMSISHQVGVTVVRGSKSVESKMELKQMIQVTKK